MATSMLDLSNKTTLTTTDLAAIEREAHRLRAEAVAGMARALVRAVVRLLGRLTHHHGTPAHG
ncbi:RSP_7527 family protein [Novispirillum sp. DQ9]|uniref:RSP_7527 family protein n=1 Tax=Novispirillum sp. DQ9 TaxID=3398612 RepID=UPI003C7C516C